MNKNALKDKRRETVISLLKGMNVNKDSNEGFDRDDVYNCIQELCNLYEGHIDELESNYESEINELTRKYHKYDENNDLYVSLIMDAKKSSQEILKQAQDEVDEILNSGKEQIALQEQKMEQFRLDGEKEREAITAELMMYKEAAEAEKAAINIETEVERERLEAIKNKYKQQINSMEDEFAEIRTNILRASSRLDALKVQVEETEPEPEWTVKETGEKVEMPDTVEEVDSVGDVEPVVAESEAAPEGSTFEEQFFQSDILDNISNAKTENHEPVQTEAEPEEPVESAIDSMLELDENEPEVEIEIFDPTVDMDTVDTAEIPEEPIVVEKISIDDIAAAVEASEKENSGVATIDAELAEIFNERAEQEEVINGAEPVEDLVAEPVVDIQELDEAIESAVEAVEAVDIADPAVVAPVTEEPVVEDPVELIKAVDIGTVDAGVQEEPKEELEALLDEISFDGLFDEEAVDGIQELDIDGLDEISLDGIEEIDLDKIDEPVVIPEVTATEEIIEPVVEPIEQNNSEEISFDALEALFKDE
ncbi:MAG: hypothetical protein Q4B78_02690 [Bacillota bacterium]|nr:hypothetical protein [Bacillota bacterium]